MYMTVVPVALPLEDGTGRFWAQPQLVATGQAHEQEHRQHQKTAGEDHRHDAGLV